MMSALCEQIARQVAKDCNELGWDQPATLWDVRFLDVPDELRDVLERLTSGAEPVEGFERTEHVAHVEMPEELKGALDGLAMLAAVRCNTVFEEHPFDGLIGKVAEPDVIAAAVAVEAWEYPEDEMERLQRGEHIEVSASNHPRRRSTRMVQLMLRNGASTFVHSYEDGAPDEVNSYQSGDPHQLRGRVVDALARYLNRPSVTAVTMSARDAARAVWLEATVRLSAHGELADSFAAKLNIPEEEIVARADLVVLLALTRPNEIIATSLDCAGMGALVADGEDDRNVIVGEGPDPEMGSPDDLAEWDRCRQAHIVHLEDLLENLDEVAGTQRRINGRPLYEIREHLEAQLRLARWGDAVLWANSLDVMDLEPAVTRFTNLIVDGSITTGAARAALTALGWDRAAVDDAVAQAMAADTKVGRNDPCPCGSGRKAKNCHQR